MALISRLKLFIYVRYLMPLHLKSLTVPSDRFPVREAYPFHLPFLQASPTLPLACPAAEIWSFDQVPLRPIAYQETEHYQIYKKFLNDPDSFLEKG